MKNKDAYPEQRSLFDDTEPKEPAELHGKDVFGEKAASEAAAASAEAVPATPFGKFSLFAEDEPFVEQAIATAKDLTPSTGSPGVVSHAEPIAPAPIETIPSRENEWAGITSLLEVRPKILACAACELRGGARGVVFGEGDPHARIMFIGEGPGQTEDETGRPFVGRAGQLLEAMLRTVGFERKEVFIANIVKCRPPGNRLPLPPEVAVCIPHLRAQIRIINPSIIVLLGALSSQTLVAPSIRVTRDRGKWFKKDGRDYLVTFHPAAVLRDERAKRPQLLEDFRSLRAKWESDK